MRVSNIAIEMFEMRYSDFANSLYRYFQVVRHTLYEERSFL